jgi:hypothetical protein
MATLLNTSWTVTADNHDFLTFTVNFQASGAASISFSNGVGVQGTWSQGKRFFSFTLEMSYPGPAEEQFNLVGSHQEGDGSGNAVIEWSGGSQKSPFSIVKNK